MAHPAKGGRPKNLWDISATIGALNEVLGDEPDPAQSAPDRSFLHFIRELCRNLEANMPAIIAFDRLSRLLREKAEPIRLYAREVSEAFTAYRPLIPSMNELLKRGEVDETWKLWFFACEMPKRLHAAMASVDRLLYAGQSFMPAPFNMPGSQLAVARAAVIFGLRSHGCGAAEIAKLLDPVGYKKNARGARDRIRKEVRRLDVMIRQSSRDGDDANTQMASHLAPKGPRANGPGPTKPIG